MKKFNVGLLLILVLSGIQSCRKVIGHGPVVTDNRTVTNFSAIHFDVPGTLYYVPDSIFKVEIQAQENVLREVETYVVGNELKIKVHDHVSLRASEDIRVNVSAPPVTALSLNGSGNLKVSHFYRPANARLTVRGSGTMTIDHLETRNVDAAVSGSGELIVFNGKADHADADVSGSGRIDLLGVMSKTARAQISGSGSARLHVTDELNTRISGSGSVYYKGNPFVNTSVTGSGKVIKL